MVSLIGMPLEEVKKAFVEWAKDCERFTKILVEERTKANESKYSTDTINRAIVRFESEYNNKSAYSF